VASSRKKLEIPATPMVTTETPGQTGVLQGLESPTERRSECQSLTILLISLEHPPDTELVVQRSVNAMECHFQWISYIGA
jgi:hypothetical protein